jgi:dolichyl-phosphate-mannose-protein mannosyltransferase
VLAISKPPIPRSLMTRPDETPKTAKTADADKKLIEYLPASFRQQPFMQKVQAWLDWLSTRAGSQWGFGALILALAIINFLPNLNNPRKPFWDESYYLTAAQRMMEGTTSFASHPPLGFMFMAAGENIVGDNKDIDAHMLARVKKTSADDVPKAFDYTGIRLPSALFAVAACLMFYLILVIALEDAFMAFVFALFFAFENGFVVHFRAAQLDGYQVGFVMAALLVWIRLFLERSRAPIRDYALFGAFIGLSFMVKVNSAPVLALGGITLLRDLWTRRALMHLNPQILWTTFAPSLKKFASMMAAFAITILLIFTLNTAITRKLPDANAPAGERDLKMMSQAYKDYASGKTGLTPAAWWASISDYSTYMKSDFTGVTSSEPNGQAAATWPWWTKTVSYRWDFDGKKTAYSLFVGNQVIWRLALIGLIASVVIISQRRFQKPKWLKLDTLSHQDLNVLEAVSIMYAVFMVIHIYLGTQRVMYIYHYFIGLILSFIMLALCFKILSERVSFMGKQKLNILTGLSVVVTAGFLFYAPFSYHTKITRAECEMRNWPAALITCMPKK